MTGRSIAQSEFDALILAHRIRGKATLDALWLVLVHAVKPAEAARQAEIGKGALSRALKKVRLPLCKKCGQPLLKAVSSSTTSSPEGVSS